MRLTWLAGSLAAAILSVCVHIVTGHGRLIEPPSRATMWRYGYNTPPNYNDHELYCGGYSRQWNKNKGKCGICGDAWDMPKPRPHEAGGKYGNGIIVRRYKMESSFTIRVELTANHKGYFEFRICPNNAPHRTATQSCLDQYVLTQARGRDNRTYGDEPAMFDDSKYYPGNGSRVFEMRYQLPRGLTCTQCVLQWRYIAGNNWGTCPNGTETVGCGSQEEFRACADVSILDSNGTADETPFDNEIPTEPEDTPVDTEKEPFETEGPMAYGLLLLLIASCTLLIIMLSCGLLYCYFYRREGLQEWWSSETSLFSCRVSGEKRPQFWERFKDKELRFWRPSAVGVEKERAFTIPQPVPPPRAKRLPKEV